MVVRAGKPETESGILSAVPLMKGGERNWNFFIYNGFVFCGVTVFDKSMVCRHRGDSSNGLSLLLMQVILLYKVRCGVLERREFFFLAICALH